MSIDKLQERIRKTKNPTVLDLTVCPQLLPPELAEQEKGALKGWGKYALDLMEGLKGLVPGVRFDFSAFALRGGEGLDLLNFLMNRAKELGFYVLLDSVQALSAQAAERASELLEWSCDGLVISSYIGSDGMKPYVKKLKNLGKSLFVALRTANKSAPELQDLMTGSRLVYMAAADQVNRLGEPLPGKYGYQQVGGLGPASSAEALRSLRGKYPKMFLLVDGYDYPNANAKNCGLAFDKLGHGAAVCVGSTITGAWNEEGAEEDYVLAARQAAERTKKNISRYITIL